MADNRFAETVNLRGREFQMVEQALGCLAVDGEARVPLVGADRRLGTRTGKAVDRPGAVAVRQQFLLDAADIDLLGFGRGAVPPDRRPSRVTLLSGGPRPVPP